MADSSSEHLIRIIVQGVNRLGDVVEKGVSGIERNVAAVQKQTKAIEQGGRTAKDAQEDFANLSKAIGEGSKDYESARFGLEELSKEFDRFARKAGIGTELSDDLHRSALAAKALSEQLKDARETNRKITEAEFKDRVSAGQKRRREDEARVKAEIKAEKDGVQARKKLIQELLDEVKRDTDEREKFAKDLADAEVKEDVRVENERQRVVAETAKAEQAEAERSAANRKSFLGDILDEVQRDHDERIKFARELADFEIQEAARVESARASSRAGRPQGVVTEQRPSFFQRARSFLSGDDSGGVRKFVNDLNAVDGASRSANTGVSRLERTIDRLSGASNDAGFSIARVDNNLRGLVIVGVVAFSQQLISAFVALAAAALAVASAAAQAGAAIGGAFVAATGQAIPAIGLLIAAFGRIGAVFDAVKLFNDQATSAGYDQAQAAEAQAAAADRIVSANEGVVAANQRVTDATDALTAAREKARQKIEDLNLAERRASLSQFQTGEAITRAIAAGDVGALEGLRNQRDEAGLAAERTSADASSARELGPERAPEVLAAVRDLDQANVALRRARREADAAGRAAERAATAGTAADRALERALAQLTPAELALYEASKRFQTRFRELFRPITDIIVRSFTRGVDRAEKVMGDSRIVDTARTLSQAIAGAFDAFTEEATSDRGLNFFKVMGEESARNIPLLATLAIRIQRIMAAIAVAGGPAFRKFIEFFSDLAKRGEEATNSQSGLAKMERFFLRGEEMAESFLKLGGAIIGLFAALAGAGGAEEGISLVEDLTASIQRATVWVQEHQKEVRAFFDDVGESTRAIAGAIFAIAQAMLRLFSSEKVVSFADAFRKVLLPALESVATALGTITFLFTEFLSLPGVSQIAQFALAFGLLFKAFSVLGKLLLPFAAGLQRVVGGMKLLGPLVPRIVLGLRVFAALLAGPVGLAIAFVITAIVLLDKKLHFIGPSLKYIGEIFDTIFNEAKRLADDVVGAINDLAGRLEFLKPILKVIGGLIATAFKFSPFGLIAGLGAKFLGLVHGVDAGKRALEGLKKAEDDLARSQRESAAAQIALTDARRAASREINDLEASVRSGRLQIRQARFGVRDARKDLAGLRASGAPSDEIDKAELRLDEARENLRTTTLSLNRAEQDLEETKEKNSRPDSPVEKAEERRRKARAKEIEDSNRLADSARKAGARDPVEDALSRTSVRGLVDGGIGRSLEILNGELNKTARSSNLITQIDKLHERLAILRKGTDEYRETAEKLRRKQHELSDVLAASDSKSRKGARGVRVIGRAATTSADAFDKAGRRIAKGFNSLAEQLGGVKKVTYSASGTTTSFGDGTDVRVDSGDILAGRATGGWINRRPGAPQGPDNRVIRVGDNEAVLAVPQQRPVEEGLRLRKAFMGGPGTLDELFGKVRGYVGAFAKGGRVGGFGGHPTNVNEHVKRLVALLQGKFSLAVTSTTDHGLKTTSGNLSDHPAGNAVDLSGARAVMFRAAEYIKSSGLYKRLKQGIHNPNLAVNRGALQKPPGQYAGAVWAQHADHLHLAITGAIGKLAAGTGALGGLAASIREPRISGPRGKLRDLAQRAVRRIARSANRRLENASERSSTTPSTLGALGNAKAQGADADVIKAFRRAISTTKAQPVERLALWMAGIVESGLRNLNYGDRDSLGALQERTSIFGRAHALNPFASAIRFIRDAISKRPWKGTAGQLAQAVQRSGFPERYDQVADRARQYLERGGKVLGRGAVPATLHGDEHVWTASEVAKAGGHRVMYALRKVLGGGRQATAGSYEIGGRVLESAVSLDAFARKLVNGIVAGLRGGGSLQNRFEQNIPNIGTRGAIDTFGSTIRNISRVQRSISRLRTRGSKFVQDFGRSISKITDENGLLDQATTALGRVTAGTARRLQRLAFRVNRSGLVVRRQTAQQEADAQIPAIDEQLRGQRSLRSTTAVSLRDVNNRLARLRKSGVTSGSAYENLIAARLKLIGEIESFDGQIADTIESRFQAQERSLQVAIDEINTAASRANTRADLTDRFASLFDNLIGGAGIATGLRGSALNTRQGALVAQRDALTPLLGRAQAQGNTSLANDLIGQIEELNVAIAENSAAITQNTVTARQATVDAIARTASRASARADLADRTASLLEAAGNAPGAFALRGSTLQDRRGSITSQRDSLIGVLADAQNNFTGTVTQQQQIEDLVDQIADLNVQLDENTQAVAQNTTAARQARIDAITQRGGFLGGVFGGLQGILKSLGELVGQESTGGIAQLLRQAGGVLAQVSEKLREELLKDFGVDLRGLDPGALVEALRNLDFDAILATLSVDDKRQFEGLISAIIENAGAVVDNTQQLSTLNGIGQQSFSSSAWQLFREAIFNGSGGLMPSYYAISPPSPMSAGVPASTSTVGPAAATAAFAGQASIAGDTINIDVTSPTEIADPAYFAQVLSFNRSIKRAT